ncbi:MFS transporter [Ferrovibrio sp.]|uniref:MFS transporter n=1 Tax=Ferrovibrio sp. TaxID=1917215 RepID=UPI003D0DAC58
MRGFYGWRVVAAAFVVAMFGWGLGFYGPPVFLHVVIQRTGWPLSLVSVAVTVHFLVGAFVAANLPALHRRFGLARVTLAGAMLLSVGLVGWGLAMQPWQLFLAALGSGVGWVCLGAAAINAIVSPWFERRRPTALATAYNGASIGGVVFSPLWVALIAGYDLTVAAIIVAGLMLAAMLLLRPLLAATPAAMGLLPDGEPANAVAPATAPTAAAPLRLWRDRRFLTLAAGMALSLFAQIGLLAHLYSLLVPVVGVQPAGFAAGLATACAIAGRSIVGWLLPARTDRRFAAAANLLVQGGGSLALLFAGDTAWFMLLGVVLFGFGIGNVTSLPPLIAQAEFPRQTALRVVALIVGIGQGGYAFAPAVFGLLRDYPALGEGGIFIAASLLQVAAIGCFLLGRPR